MSGDGLRVGDSLAGRGVLGALLFAVAGALAWRYVTPPAGMTAIAFPASVLLVALLVTAPRWWAPLVVATLLLQIVGAGVGATPQLLVEFTIGAVGTVLAAAALRALLEAPARPQGTRDVGWYGVVAVLLVPAAVATITMATMPSAADGMSSRWREAYLAVALAHLTITPAILYWVISPPRRWWSVAGRRRLEAALLAVGLAIASWVAFDTRLGGDDLVQSRHYIPLPFMLWAALRFGMQGTTGAVVLVTLVSFHAASSGRGAFAGQSEDATVAALQHYLFLRAAPLYLLGVFAEQARRAEQRLRASQERYRQVVDTQTDLVCRYRPDTTLTFVNAAYCRYFTRTAEELIGTSFLELLPEHARAPALRYMDLVAAEPGYRSIEHEVTLPDGGVGWQRWIDYPIYGDDGQIEEFQAIGHDITERKRAEEVSRNLAHLSRLATVGELTATIAHEVNQPLCAILWNAQAGLRLLEAENPPLQDLHEILADICRDDQRADETIQRIRGLAGKRNLRLEPLDLNAAVKSMLAMAAGDASLRRIRVVSELDPDLPTVSGDLVHLQQVLLNLLVNAMDAIGETGSLRTITVQTMARGDRVEVSVADSGAGIPSEELSHIFQSFVTTKPSGMGMGLAIARSIIEAHGGRIWAENNSGGGATFRFSVRCALTERALPA